MRHFSPILASGDEIGKVIGGVVFVLIWAVGALVSYANKKQQEEKRRRLRETVQRTQETMASRLPPPPRPRLGDGPGPLPPPLPSPAQQRPVQQRALEQRVSGQRRIAEGLATRYPEVLQPPDVWPAPRSATSGGRAATQQKAPVRRPVPMPQKPSRPAQKPPRGKPLRRAPILQQSPPQAQPNDPARKRALSAAAPSLPTAAQTHAAPSAATASALHQWMNPQTLRSQYILTEVLQPPLALRTAPSLPML